MEDNYREMQSESDENHGEISFYNAQNRTVKLPNFLWNAMQDIVKRRGFMHISEFIRYAIRKEVEYQLDIIYSPQLKRDKE